VVEEEPMTRRRRRSGENEKALAAELYARRNDPADWEEAPIEVKVHPSRAIVTSLRLPTQEFIAVQRAARTAGMTTSEFIRSAIAAKLHGGVVLNTIQVTTGSSEGRSQATVLVPMLKGGDSENPGPVIPLYANLVG
jgi:hypothetical protein